MKCNAQQLLLGAFFDIMRILAALSPKVNLLSCFSTLQYFKNGNLSSALDSLQWGEIDMRAYEIQF